MNTITAQFVHDRETKNAVRFEEVTETGQEPVVGTLYLRKVAVSRLGGPTELVVQIGVRR